jgi:hypothetical protein
MFSSIRLVPRFDGAQARPSSKTMKPPMRTVCHLPPHRLLDSVAITIISLNALYQHCCVRGVEHSPYQPSCHRLRPACRIPDIAEWVGGVSVGVVSTVRVHWSKGGSTWIGGGDDSLARFFACSFLVSTSVDRPSQPGGVGTPVRSPTVTVRTIACLLVHMSA